MSREKALHPSWHTSVYIVTRHLAWLSSNLGGFAGRGPAGEGLGLSAEFASLSSELQMHRSMMPRSTSSRVRLRSLGTRQRKFLADAQHCATWNAAETSGYVSWSYAGAVHHRYPGGRADSSNSGAVGRRCSQIKTCTFGVQRAIPGQSCGQICDHGYIRRDKTWNVTGFLCEPCSAKAPNDARLFLRLHSVHVWLVELRGHAGQVA